MTEHILFLTGKLAERRLRAVLESMQPVDFSWEVRNLGLSVAGLMTAGMLTRRLTALDGVNRIMVPGLCGGDLAVAGAALGVPVIRGPDDLKDLPEYFGRGGKPTDLGRRAVRIFAEIVEAPRIAVEDIVRRARRYRRDGADVIDIGCLPDTDFPHLEEAVQTLKAEGFEVSIDSADSDELLRGARAGAGFLLSLSESTLWVAAETDAVPVLIPEPHGDLESLYRAMDQLRKLSRPFIADSVLDPIHFGFVSSLQRYAELRSAWPDADILMGIGNLTELTEADTIGINALLLGIISELGIGSVLTTEVSPHARSAVREADLAARIMYAAKEAGQTPKGVDGGLLGLHERRPFPYSAREVAELAAEIRDPSYRVQVSDEGIHVFNRDGMVLGIDPFALFPQLPLLGEDAPHAFYMGVELARAQVAWQLGKRYVQDEELSWGVSGMPANAASGNESRSQRPAGTTLEAAGRGRRNT
jgi:dihydropteroate synthase